MNFEPPLNWLGYGGYVVAGIFVVLGMFGMQSKSRRQENDALTSKLIENLNATVKQQESEIKKLTTENEKQGTIHREEMHTLRDQLNQLSGENKVLKELFTGRNPMQEEAFKAAIETNKAITELTHLIGELVKKLDTSATINP